MQVIARGTGMPITLSVLYLLCASELGVKCRGVNYPGHFYLACQHPQEEEEEARKSYVDAFDGGKRVLDLRGATSEMEVGPRMVFLRFLRNFLNVARNPLRPRGDGDQQVVQRRCYELWLVMVEAGGGQEEEEQHRELNDNIRRALTQVYMELNINQVWELHNVPFGGGTGI